MRIIMIILALLLLGLQAQLWRQYGRVTELEQRIETQRDQNATMKARNDVLAAEVLDLKSGLDAVEERARSELGFVREDETFYLIVAPNDLIAPGLDALQSTTTAPADAVRVVDRKVDDQAARQGAPGDG
ncbi:MAG: septum formation initiator family protein [Xanthomonadaceae bacterium]|nr:septum formation initiator family protein [Xanthomonadaceae bacterium]